ncbi:50S ribosomal protein L31 [Candidatus Methylomirabilis lanthanidiphila]|uniref:Large ribosomal subunit protein bL31 n=1 Tax=Candidatus Methylomirabilis lanthanidiphila TaxID=2211376 RepID=A0A564ZG30_9BACT|nr:50S ribosomal protein L31 [Candidatus Methylomirabilis lanthanidiphila]VUZ84123.1 50S ribosomal protein L31 [Candidatus Methylomirabilis lanthanidiphila]
MKPAIHPNYQLTTITCACGEVIHTRSTAAALRVEICSKCHPLFTGRQKLIDTEGRVDRFRRKYAKKPKAAQAGQETAAAEVHAAASAEGVAP